MHSSLTMIGTYLFGVIPQAYLQQTIAKRASSPYTSRYERRRVEKGRRLLIVGRRGWERAPESREISEAIGGVESEPPVAKLTLYRASKQVHRGVSPFNTLETEGRSFVRLTRREGRKGRTRSHRRRGAVACRTGRCFRRLCPLD